MVKVTKESLEKKIKQLSSRSNPEFGLGLTISEEYQLEAYKMLLELLPECEHDWQGDYGFQHKGGFSACCRKCGKVV